MPILCQPVLLAFLVSRKPLYFCTFLVVELVTFNFVQYLTKKSQAFIGMLETYLKIKCNNYKVFVLNGGFGVKPVCKKLKNF